MKKYIVIIILVFATLITFASCSNNFVSENSITDYKQTLYYDEGTKTLFGEQIVNYYNSSNNTLSNIMFHLYANAFKERAKATVVSQGNYEKAYKNGPSFGSIDILSVHHKNKQLNYAISGKDENILDVELSQQLLPESRYEIKINFVVKLPNIDHRFGYGENTTNFGNYYPIACVYENEGFVTDLYNSNGDPFYSKCANYDVELTLDKNLIIASTGAQTQVDTNTNYMAQIQKSTDIKTNDIKTINISAKKVRDFAFVVSKKFNIISENYDGIDINYYYYSDKSPNNSFNAIKQILDFNKTFAGKYAYSTYSVAESNFVHGGMEFPQLVLISDDLGDNDTYINVIIHETCHQWWYGVVGNNEYNCAWIDEGLTDYNTAIFYDAYPEYALTSETIFKNANKLYNNFIKIYSGVYKNLDTSMNRKLDEFQTEYEYVYCTYTKGMLLFNEIHNVVGDKKFDTAIKQLYKNYAYSEINEDQLITLFENATHKPLKKFIKSWTTGKVQVVA